MAFMAMKRVDLPKQADEWVRIHELDGKIQDERTYPRGADPRRSKG
jgi:hypothetical protein